MQLGKKKVFILAAAGLALLAILVFGTAAIPAILRTAIGLGLILGLLDKMGDRKIGQYMRDLAATQEGRIRLYTGAVIFIAAGLFFLFVVFFIKSPASMQESGGRMMVDTLLTFIAGGMFAAGGWVIHVVRKSAPPPTSLD